MRNAVTSGRRVEAAIRYAQDYRGAFVFMRTMRTRAQQTGWIPTENEIQAILRCAARDLARSSNGTLH